MITRSHYLTLRIYSRKAFDSKEKARQVLDFLQTHSRFSPDRFGELEPLKPLTSQKIDQAISLIANEAGQRHDPERVISSVIFTRTRLPCCRFYVDWNKLPHEAFSISMYKVEDDFIADRIHRLQWLEFAFGLLGLQEAWYAGFALDAETHQKNFMLWRTQHSGARDPHFGVEGGRGVGVKLLTGIPGVYWGNYFGPFYVDWLGREKFEDLPCVEKRWLDSGGVYFTTAATPFDWNSPEAVQLQQAVKDHLGAEAFFDIETVRRNVAALEPIPENMEPEQFQPPRRLPIFPFTLSTNKTKTVEVEMAEAKEYFTSNGFELVGIEGQTLIFSDGKGGMTRVTVGPGGSVEYWPRQ